MKTVGAFLQRDMGYTVYILQSERDGSYYIGQTASLEERIRRHNEGRGRYTRTKIPWRLVYREEFVTRGGAMIREKGLKARKDRGYIEQLVRASR